MVESRTLKNPLYSRDIQQFVLKNKVGTVIKLLDYGGIITHFVVRLPDGKTQDIVLGFDDPFMYMGDHPCFGAIVGRYANRIAQGTFQIDENKFVLARNHGKHHLHGGVRGFDKVFWNVDMVEEKEGEGVRLRYLSKDGEEGYPGNLKAEVTFLLSDENQLTINYVAETDKPTYVNLTHHDYFNLGLSGQKVYRHEARFLAESYLDVDEELIPTGILNPVRNSPFDFSVFKPIGQDISQINPGYDHCFIFSESDRDNDVVVEVRNPENGLVLEMITSEPGVQFYTGNFLDGSLKGKHGIAYGQHTAFCLEAQHYPDSPNHPDFPSTLLIPGERYYQKTVYRIRSHR